MLMGFELLALMGTFVFLSQAKSFLAIFLTINLVLGCIAAAGFTIFVFTMCMVIVWDMVKNG